RLDDIMKALYDEYYQKQDRGFTDQEFREMAEKISGVSLEDIYGYVNEPKPIDYNVYLKFAGMELINQLEGYSIPDFGAHLSNNKVTSVSRGSGAWNAGINVRDEIIAINGYRIDEAGNELDRILLASKVGEELEVLLSRDGIIKKIQVNLSANTKGDYIIQPMEKASAEQIKIRNLWLSLDK